MTWEVGRLIGLGGVQIIVDDALMTKFVEDWSDVRSPARARRRRARGFPQRIRLVKSLKPDVYRVGDRLIMSSETAAELKRALKAGDAQ